ncbi:MAG: AAA family ATPase [Thiolinea sp.]
MTKVVLIGDFCEKAQENLLAIPNVEIIFEQTFKLPLNTLPELLVLEFSGEYQTVLNSLNKISPERRPVLIAIIPAEDAQLLRQAMHAGARDYLVLPLDVLNLQTMVESFLRESGNHKPRSPGKVTAVISATSNADSAFITANLAQITAERAKQSVMVLDLDLQFSSLPVILDVEPERSLLQAMEVIETLDEVALNAYLTNHESGLKVLCSLVDDIALPGEISADSIHQVITIAGHVSQNLFINLPHIIDPLSSQVVDDADQIIICIEQSFPSMNFAKGLLNILLNELDVPAQKIILLVNRFRNKHKILQPEIEKTIGLKPTIIVPSDSRALRDAERYGLLLSETANQTQAYKSLIQLAERLSGTRFAVHKSLLNRIMDRIEGKAA